MPGYTDQVYSEFRLYIEGVEVPFEGITISSDQRQLPQANLQLFPFKSMEIINRFYQPKVHIFYVNPDNEYQEELLFSGHIQASSYSKRTTGQGSSKSVSYQCVHRYQLLDQVTISFTSLNKDNTVYGQSAGTQARSSVGSTSYMFSQSLKGVTGVKDGIPIPGTKSATVPEYSDIDKLPAYLSDPFHTSRYAGMVGCVMNMWNQFKYRSNAPSNANSMDYNQAMTEMYIPLVEEGLESEVGSGLRFFNRISGIPTIDGELQAQPIVDSEGNRKHLPPNLRTLASQIDSLMASLTSRDSSTASGESVSFSDMVRRFAQFIEYQTVCLASPAKVSPENEALDYLITPKLTCYFSPSCNVVYPNMFDDLRIQDDSGASPTRMEGKSRSSPGGSEVVNNFRSPPSVRNALVDRYAVDLLGTTRNLSDAIGKYEYGRGVIPKITQLPDWVNSLDSLVITESLTPSEAEKHNLLSKSYAEQYGSKYDIWDPLTRHSFKWAALDLVQFNAQAEARNGSLSGNFNPNIVPGYPMDILDSDRGSPCYHAFCTSVTHVITSSSCETSVSFTAALTYEELANYRTPSVNPWLSSALQILTGQWLGNEDAKRRADTIYSELLGVNAIDPYQIYDFEGHGVRPFYVNDLGNVEYIENESMLNEYAQEANPWFTYQGNLRSTQRPIETLRDVEESFQLKFISAGLQYGTTEGVPLIYYPVDNLQVKEFGQSLFLDYRLVAEQAKEEAAAQARSESTPEDD